MGRADRCRADHPCYPHLATIWQVRNLLRRLSPAAALTAGLTGCPVHLLVRLAAGSVFYGDPVTRPGKRSRPGKHGRPVTCHKADAADQANP